MYKYNNKLLPCAFDSFFINVDKVLDHNTLVYYTIKKLYFHQFKKKIKNNMISKYISKRTIK